MSTAAAPAAGAPAPAAAPAATPSTVPAAESAATHPSGRPVLPGVLDSGPEPAVPVVSRRDASGRFVKGEPSLLEPPDPNPLPARYKFAGREFDTQEAAEHYYRSMEGRHRPIQEAATRHETQLVKAAESARGWHAEAQRLQAELKALQEQAPKPAEPAGEQKGIDWQLYAEVSRIANEAGEPWKAQQWLQEQVDAQRAADIAAIREDAIDGPRREAEADAMIEATANDLAQSMADHTNPDGSPAFPEFRDPQTAHDVGHLWQSLGLDPHAALTPGGAVAAVALYRMARALGAAPVAAAPVAPVAVNPAALAAAGVDSTGRSLMPAAADRGSLAPEAARLVTGLKNANLLRPGIGFEA